MTNAKENNWTMSRETFIEISLALKIHLKECEKRAAESDAWARDLENTRNAIDEFMSRAEILHPFIKAMRE